MEEDKEMSTYVAPCAGAWIETCSNKSNHGDTYVAPCAGAWIGTLMVDEFKPWLESPPARGRGLKLIWRRIRKCLPMSPPARGRGLKQNSSLSNILTKKSPPARGRGLKQGVLVLMLLP
jgi:hypothetical protein